MEKAINYAKVIEKKEVNAIQQGSGNTNNQPCDQHYTNRGNTHRNNYRDNTYRITILFLNISSKMTNKGMHFFHVNTRSLFSKLNQIENLYGEADILCCTETWLDNRFSNDSVKISQKSIFSCDRLNNITSFNARPTAGGVCIYVDNVWANYTKCIYDCSVITPDYEIITIVTSRPNHKAFVTIYVYKPPKGKIDKCIKFLLEILDNNDVINKEIWIMGDLNTDLLKRDNPGSIQLQKFAKKNGLKMLISEITRPNVRGGTCIDHIMSNCVFISDCGVCDDYGSGSFYCICYS